MKKISLIVLVFMLMAITGVTHAQQQPVSISQARLTPVGDTVTIIGLVLNGSELGVIRYLQDSTGGLAIYDSSMGYLQRGDLVRVTGIMDEYQQLLELVDIFHDTVYSSGNQLPQPLVITPSQFGEIHESVKIRINDVTFSNAGNTFSGNTNYNILSQGEQTVIRIANNNPLVGQLIPTGMVDLIGIGSQFHYTDPNAGYQMMIRDLNDILPQSSISFDSPLEVSNITTTGFDLSWTSNVAGTGGLYYGITNDPTTLITSPGTSTQHQVSVTGLNPAEIVYVKAFVALGTDTTYSGVSVYATQSLSSGDIKVYFTGSVDQSFSTGTNALQLNNLVDDTMIAYINRADQSVDMAIYSFNTANISNIATALNDAHQRGVDVRVVYCGTNTNPSIQNLDPAIGKIASPTTSGYAIMHNKFLIIDAHHSDPNRAFVFTGSMNFTNTCINNWPNNVLFIQDQSLAKGYTLEFEEMFGSNGLQPDPVASRFGPFKTNNTPHDYIIGGRTVKSFFSPSDGVNTQLIKHIESAQHEVFVNTVLITRSDIAYALRDQSQASVDVKVLINHPNESSTLVVDVLTDALGSNFSEYGESGILHHKAMIIDPLTPGATTAVWTGSHNWSNAAEQRNDENTLIIFDTTIANLYLQEFMARWALANPLQVNGQKNSNMDLTLFPNPSSGDFTIKTFATNQGHGALELYSLDGRKVSHTALTLQYGENLLKVHASLTPGVYLYRLSTPDGVANGRLIIR
jgi:phosphatidylserine/phosphatidylglycerophosphate/cardiolipin synthase-like enzyme